VLFLFTLKSPLSQLMTRSVLSDWKLGQALCWLLCDRWVMFKYAIAFAAIGQTNPRRFLGAEKVG